MLKIYSDNLFTIGILNGTKQPVVTAPNLRNVPKNGVFAFNPGAYFGVYNPEAFYYASAAKSAAATKAKGR